VSTLGTLVNQGGGHGGFHHELGACGNLDQRGSRQTRTKTMPVPTGAGSGEDTFSPNGKANTGGPNDIFQCALSDSCYTLASALVRIIFKQSGVHHNKVRPVEHQSALYNQ